MLESTVYVTEFVSTGTLNMDPELRFTQTFWFTYVVGRILSQKKEAIFF